MRLISGSWKTTSIIPWAIKDSFVHSINTYQVLPISQALGQQQWTTKQSLPPSLHKIHIPGASLVAQWLRVCLPIQGTRVRALVWEDPTCHRATRPVSHNYWACASGACAPQQERPRQWEARNTAMKSGPRLLQLEKALAQKRRPNTAINK